jgi:hypothetical protein|tara:strand:- start:13910 stop:14161 length:252 start_codon:yes stop_codon:yes gene_type:complete
MAQQPEMKGPNIDLTNTTAITSSTGGKVFSEGVILRKISKFVAGTAEDAIMPIPVFYDVITGEVMVDMIPKELRDEFTEEPAQ